MGKERHLMLPRQLLKSLQLYRETMSSWEIVNFLLLKRRQQPVLHLNYQDEPISERGIRKLVVKYRKNAGITKRASCHTLRHTFATYKAERGVSPFQLQQWLGHANLNTTQIYVHLGKQNAKKIMEQTSLA